jgi:hypothetical protein
MMDSRTGEIYPSINDAKKAFESFGMAAKEVTARMNDLVEVSGTEEAVQSISDSVKADRRRKNKAARKARKRNRK